MKQAGKKPIKLDTCDSIRNELHPGVIIIIIDCF